jgi:hypothetical protein
MNHLSALDRRISKLEKNQWDNNTTYLLADGSTVTLSNKQRVKGFEDALYSVDSYEATVLLTATGANNEGANLLKLLHAIVNPEFTHDPNERNEAQNVGSERVAHE